MGPRPPGKPEPGGVWLSLTKAPLTSNGGAPLIHHGAPRTGARGASGSALFLDLQVSAGCDCVASSIRTGRWSEQTARVLCPPLPPHKSQTPKCSQDFKTTWRGGNGRCVSPPSPTGQGRAGHVSRPKGHTSSAPSALNPQGGSEKPGA